MVLDAGSEGFAASAQQERIETISLPGTLAPVSVSLQKGVWFDRSQLGGTFDGAVSPFGADEQVSAIRTGGPTPPASGLALSPGESSSAPPDETNSTFRTSLGRQSWQGWKLMCDRSRLDVAVKRWTADQGADRSYWAEVIWLNLYRYAATR
jgi:hypothetical protein